MSRNALESLSATALAGSHKKFVECSGNRYFRLVEQRLPQVQNRASIRSGFSLHRLLELRRAAGKIPLLSQFQPEAKVGFRNIGIQTDRLPIMRQRFRIPPQLHECQPQVHLHLRIRRIELERIQKIRRRLVIPAFAENKLRQRGA